MDDEKNREEARKTTSILVNAAAQGWAKAPMHIKAMAGAYVGPLLAAMLAINDELKRINDAKK